MTAIGTLRTWRRVLPIGSAALVLAAMALVATGCGGKDFKNKPRPPVAVELTGVIQGKQVTISPNKEGAGPVQITISNQTAQAHTVTLEGDSVSEQVGPIQPEDTATLQKTLAEGSYAIKAGSDEATDKPIKPATLTIGPPRKNSNDKLLLP
jgi:hypothetical protein